MGYSQVSQHNFPAEFKWPATFEISIQFPQQTSSFSQNHSNLYMRLSCSSLIVLPGGIEFDIRWTTEI